MTQKQDPILTPWQKAYAKFQMSQAAFSRVLGRHRSKISRALRDTEGLISGNDQKLILEKAKTLNVAVLPSDLTPDV